MSIPTSVAQQSEDPAWGSPEMQQSAPLLSPEDLNNLVAPVALYPDPLLSQVLAASTYPREIVDAHQWLGQNNNLQGALLMEAARQQNWDPSVQALVAFPDALNLLANDIEWATDLGNAFLAQQADVMGAVQGLRAQARASGKLNTTRQQVVTMDAQDDPGAIEILPADPQVVYVPVYNPAYVWGPPVWRGNYHLWYPPGFAFGFGFGRGIYMSSYYPSWGGWGNWGWGFGWSGRNLFLNTGFFRQHGFRGGYYGRPGGFAGSGGRAVWAHNPSHRMGIPYANRAMATRFHRFSEGQVGGRMNRGPASGGARAGGGQRNSGQFTGNQGNRGSAGASGFRSNSSGNWQRFGDGNRSSSNAQSERGLGRSGDSGFRTGGRGQVGPSRQVAPNNGGGGAQGYRAPAQGSRGFGGQSYQSAPSNNRSSSPAPSGRGFSRSGDSGFRTGGRGELGPSRQVAPNNGGGGAQSYRAPGQGSRGVGRQSNQSAPSDNRSFSRGNPAPRGQSFSAPRPSSGSRGSSGGSGFSGGRSGGDSGSSGGRSGGGGRQRR